MHMKSILQRTIELLYLVNICIPKLLLLRILLIQFEIHVPFMYSFNRRRILTISCQHFCNQQIH